MVARALDFRRAGKVGFGEMMFVGATLCGRPSVTTIDSEKEKKHTERFVIPSQSTLFAQAKMQWRGNPTIYASA